MSQLIVLALGIASATVVGGIMMAAVGLSSSADFQIAGGQTDTTNIECTDYDNNGLCINITAPKGGETLEAGSNYTIRWVQRDIARVSIGYKTCSSCFDSIGEPYDVDPTQINQSYTWNIPLRLNGMQGVIIEIKGINFNPTASFRTELAYSQPFNVGPICGNGSVDSGEQCDDGNTVNGDGCQSDCTLLCIDTDNGTDWETKGEVRWYGIGRNFVDVDNCFDTIRAMPEYVGPYVVEGTCGGQLTDLNSVYHLCEYGCENGACKLGPGSCIINEDCLEGQYCNTTVGLCTDITSPY